MFTEQNTKGISKTQLDIMNFEFEMEFMMILDDCVKNDKFFDYEDVVNNIKSNIALKYGLLDKI